MLSVMQSCAERWNIKMLYVLGPSKNTSEWWCFERGKPPKLERKLNVGIP
jgi:hypothetical protein